MVRRLALTLSLSLALVLGIFVFNVASGNTPSLGLDLQGGASVTLTPTGTFDEAALSVAVDIIRQRVDSIGVAEPEIIRQGSTVVVNLPGVKDQQRALDLVGRTGSVEMRPVIGIGQSQTTTTVPGASSTSTTPGGSTTTLAGPDGGAGSVRRPRAAATTTSTTPTNSQLPPGQEVLPGMKDGLLYVVGPAGATGEVFTNDAAAEIQNGAWVVVAKLRSGAEGADLWNSLARTCYDGGDQCPTKAIAIVLDGQVVSAPEVKTPSFTEGSVQISGNFTQSEAGDLAKILQFGAVPVKFDVPTVQTVSATLGKDSLRAALVSGGVGILLVLLFLLFYYRLLALVVVGGLAVSGLLLWSVISWLSKTNGLALTLSGAAGIIVSIGVTVDSYVVFFEKLKDDVRLGRSLRNSAARGFGAAWKTILIADTVSLIGAFILWMLTVGSVRGFAFFLGLSTLSDMFVSYFYSRPVVLMLSRTSLFNKGKVLGVGAATPVVSGEAV